MIQTYTWELDLEDRDPETVMSYLDTMGAGVMAKTHFMQGIQRELSNETFLQVSVRVYGKDRWDCQKHAKMIASKLFEVGMLHTVPVVHVKTVTEPNRWTLKDGEGRTPRPRPLRINPLPE